MINKEIWLNEPTIWTYTLTKDKCLIEPMIENFEKFNSNTGWTPDQTSPWIEVMQALSHYSYHSSQRSVLFCDLQGEYIIQNNCIVIKTGRKRIKYRTRSCFEQ